MANRKEFESRIAAIIPEWNKAEEDIKIAEQIGGKVVFPSIKELRYAGRRVVDALDKAAKSDFATACDYLTDAHFDCVRARHDAIDVAVSTVAAEAAVISKKLGYQSVLAAFPDYPKLRKCVIESQKKIASSRSNRDKREEVYATVEGVKFKELIDLFLTFQASEPVMRQLARTARWKMVGAWTVGGLGLGGTALSNWQYIAELISSLY